MLGPIWVAVCGLLLVACACVRASIDRFRFRYVWRDAVEVLARNDGDNGGGGGSASRSVPKKRRRQLQQQHQQALLSAETGGSRQRHQLLRMQRERVLGALCECFVHCHGGGVSGSSIVDKDHFDAIMPEVVRQLDPDDKTLLFTAAAGDDDDDGKGMGFRRGKRSAPHGGGGAPGSDDGPFGGRAAIMRGSASGALGQHLSQTEPFLSYTLGAVVPCVVQLARAAADDTLWKPLHFKVCMKSRSDDWRVRFSALKVCLLCFVR